MASTSAVQIMQVPQRSISLPASARLHPNVLKVEGELNKFKTWESSFSSSSSIQNGLTGLAELYNCIEELIQSPCTQKALRNQQHKKLVEEALDTSIGLLDACSNARELILMMKEQAQDVQSALRRRVGDSSMDSNVHAYISFRRKSKKNIAKCLRALKKAESNGIKSSSDMLDGNDQHLSMVINVLRKLMPVASKGGQEIFNEVGNVDAALFLLHGQILKNNDAKFDVQIAHRRLETLGSCIKGVDSRLDCLFRRLIQNRVSLLNVLTP
ncbi:uncharacterized protein LOC18036235 [Citrus clementina]|uniref:uncharacterized protein LOC18036235 n=1 Tax=Citrus clementina TaxID=85681 RepID=UPI000CECE754|nr:uncharacterized protein LOC18036235 [Citrus x clementina]